MVATITDAETEAVAAAIQAYVTAVEARDFAACEYVVAQDPDLAWYGSMPGQISGWAEVEPLIRDMFASMDETCPGDRVPCTPHAVERVGLASRDGTARRS